MRTGLIEKRAEQISNIVCSAYGFKHIDVMALNRDKYLVQARHMAVFFIKREIPEISYPALGRVFNREHATVMHSVKVISQAIETQRNGKPYNKQIYDKFIEVSEMLERGVVEDTTNYAIEFNELVKDLQIMELKQKELSEKVKSFEIKYYKN